MNFSFREQSIGTRFTLPIVLVAFVALAGHFAVSATVDRRNAHLVLVDQTVMLARMAAEYSVGDLAFGYLEEAAANLDKLFMHSDIEEAQIYDASGVLFSSRYKDGVIVPPCPPRIDPALGPAVFFPNDRLEVYQPMSFRGRRHGTLRLVASTASFQAVLNARLTMLGAFLVVTLLLVGLLALGIQHWISRPILELIGKVQEIAGGHLGIRVEMPASGWEIISLCRNVNQMADALESRMREVERSRQLLQFVSDNIPAYMFWKDRQGHYVWANRLFAESAGVGSPENIVGKTDFDLPWTREQTSVFRKSDERIMSTGTPEFHLIEPQTNADGSVIWLDTSKVPLHDGLGVVSGVLGSSIDITRRKRAEEALQESERHQREAAARYEALIGASNTGAWEHHEDTGFLWCSPEYFSMLGRDIRDFDMSGTANLEATWFSLLHPEDRERAEKAFVDYLKHPEGIYQQNFRLRHSDGHWIWIWSRGKTLRDAQGQPTAITVGTHIDITERITLEERLRQSEKMEAIGQLAGGVAHDFNNQLAGIQGSAELILNQAPEPKLRSLAENILRASLRSAELTKKLLAFARKGKIVTAPVNVHQVIGEVVILLQHSIDRRITVTRHLTADPPMTFGDAGQLQSALLNLALNARDAMPEGGELSFTTARIELDDKSNGFDLPPGTYLQISVADTGCGMTKEVQSHLFEPFYTTKELGKGTGLGLAAVYGAIKSHGGAIRCYSEPGKGTIFRIILPMSADFAAEGEGPKPFVHASGQGRILLVDDEEIVREVTREMLESLGYEVKACQDGVEAILAYRTSWQEIDLVILDMIMPKMDGREVYQMLRKVNPEVRVVLASGFSLDGAANQLLQEGVLGFLQKPYQMSELAGKIRQLISGPGPGK